MTRRNELPPGPPVVPILGNLLRVRLDSLKDLSPLAERYGPIFSLRLGARTIVVLASAETIHEVLVGRAAACGERPHLLNTDAISGGGQSTLLGNGTAWNARRRLMTRAFLRPQHLPEMVRLVSAELDSVVTGLDNATAAAPVTIRLYADLFRVAQFDIAARLLTGTSGPHDTMLPRAIRDAVEAESRHFGPVLADFLPILRPWARWRLRALNRSVDQFTDYFGALIKDRQTAEFDGRPSGVIDALLLERERMSSTGDAEPDRSCADSVLPYMLYNIFGTMNPTHITVMRALVLLLQHPASLARARAEIDAVGVSSGSGPELSGAELDRLPYVTAVINETMRLQPPTPSLVPRLVTEDIITSQGFLIPRGAILLANIASLGHDERYWPAPQAFRPERFLDEDAPSGCDRRGVLHMLPFGTGPRACPAKLLGTTIAVLWVARLLREFELQLAEPAAQSPHTGIPRHRTWTRRAHIFNALPQDVHVRIRRRQLQHSGTSGWSSHIGFGE